MRQIDKVLRYLQENKTANRVNIGKACWVIDVPKVISLLRAQGYSISGHREKNGTMTYTLESSPERIVEPKRWGFSTGVAREI